MPSISTGIVLGLLAFFSGAFFLSIHLPVVNRREHGDNDRILLGDTRAGAYPASPVAPFPAANTSPPAEALRAASGRQPG